MLYQKELNTDPCRCRYMSFTSKLIIQKYSLVDGDSDFSRLLALGNHNIEYTILQISTDEVRLNSLRERETPSELPNLAFSNPEFWFWRACLSGLLLLLFFTSDSRGRGWSCDRRISIIVIILDCSGVALLRRSINFSFLAFRAGGGLFWLSGLGVQCSLTLALDEEGLGVGEFDREVVLSEAWEFAVELVRVGCFCDIESRSEGLRSALRTAASLVVGLIELRK